MKKIVIALYTCCALLTACAHDAFVFTSFREPATHGLRFLTSTNGLQWDSIPGVWLKPAVGKQSVMRDPSIAVSPDGVYHLVWTSSWKGDLGFGHATSRDLVHWSQQRFIQVMTDPTTVNVWAPEVFWDDERQEFMVVWASCIPGKFAKGEEDEDNNHRLYYTTTKDFEHFAPTQLFFDPGFSCIDATIVKRAKHDYVLVFKDNTRKQRNLRVAFAKDAHGPWKNVSQPFTESFTEGPSVVEVPKGYLIYFDRYRTGDYPAVFTTDFKTFEDAADRVSVPKGHKHGTILRVPTKVVENLKNAK